MGSKDTITYLIIEVDGTITTNKGILSVAEARRVVGGDFENLPQPHGINVVLLAATNGKEEGQNPNWVATSVVKSRLRPDDFVVGRIVVTGPPDEQGNLTGISGKAEATVRAMGER